MSYTVTNKAQITWTDGTGQVMSLSDTLSAVTKTKRIKLQGVDNSGWFKIYDASDTTTPPLGNADTGDAPFQLAIMATGQSTIVKFTDSLAGIQYMTIPVNQWFRLPTDVFGSTTAAVIATIHVKSSDATVLTGEVLLQHD